MNDASQSVADRLGGGLDELVGTLAANAAQVDADARFPVSSLDALRRGGLLGLLVPERFGGLGGDYRDLAEVSARLAGGCTSTALIWAMHCQQVDSIVRFGSARLCEVLLPRIAAGEVYIASVTTERATGGHLLTAQAALAQDARGFEFDRDAPIVTGGEHADGFLITMRDAADAGPNKVTLVYAERAELTIDQTDGWDTLGMRGTRSIGMMLRGRVSEDRIVGRRGEYRTVAVESMIPAAHIAWSACWLGVARTAYRQVVDLIRSPRRPRGLDPASPLTAVRLARVRADLELVSAYLRQVTDEVVAHQAADLTLDRPELQIHINTLKITAAERAFGAVDGLIELVGLSTGYSKSSPVPLERYFRDLRSASLNYSNERLLVANGALALLDRNVTLA